MRWVGCFVLVVVGLILLTGGIIGALVGRGGYGHPPFPFFLFPIFIVAVIAIAVAGGMRRITRPMSSFIEAARKIESGDYSARVPEWGTSDIRSVAHAFNSMAARLKSIDEQRRSFLADVTHELRTPLSVIRGQAEAIADGVYPADPGHLAPILDATRALERLVEDLRTLVMTDAGSLVLNKEATDIGSLVTDVVDSFRSQSEAAGVELKGDVGEGLPPLDVDPVRIRQVIGNLVSNALRHTPSGERVIVAAAASSDSVSVTVADTGEGIPTDLLPHVFERFAKGPGSTGSGLGLAIAHDLAQAHRGRLEIESAPGKGTTTRLVLPFDAKPA